MNPRHDLDASLRRWQAAGLIDDTAAERIRTFEGDAGAAGTGWPVRLALGLGALLLAAGMLLFVAAHWDRLAPSARFAILLATLAALHGLGAVAAPRLPALSTALHGVGTAALGGGIFLAGQIFHLQEHWPTGLLLWAVGAWAGYALRRDAVQLALAAVLTPAWLMSEWGVRTGGVPAAALILAEGVLLLALVYFTAPVGRRTTPVRASLLWIGGLAVFPAAIAVLLAGERGIRAMEPSLALGGWSIAYALPLALAAALHGRAAWPAAAAAGWIFVFGLLVSQGGDAAVHAWAALGTAGLVGWGVRDGRRERVNVGIAGFALTVVFFYFSSVMDRIGRSASLVGLGVLFLAGGWLLERARRRLVAQAVEAAS